MTWFVISCAFALQTNRPSCFLSSFCVRFRFTATFPGYHTQERLSTFCFAQRQRLETCFHFLPGTLAVSSVCSQLPLAGVSRCADFFRLPPTHPFGKPAGSKMPQNVSVRTQNFFATSL